MRGIATLPLAIRALHKMISHFVSGSKFPGKLSRILFAALILPLLIISACSKKEEAANSNEIHIRIVHPPELKEYLNRLKGAFEQSEKTLAGGLRVRLDLIEENGLTAARKIATGEIKTEAWLAPSSALVNFTNGNLKNLGPQQVDCKEMFATPVVVATLDKNLAYFDAKEGAFSWNQLISRVRADAIEAKSTEAVISLGIAQPESVSGGIAALLQLANFAIGNVEGTLGVKHVTSDGYKTRFADFFGLISYFEPNEDELLKRIARIDDTRVTAALTTEQAVAMYNSKNRGTSSLSALYPREGSIWQDYELCLSNADWVSPPQRAGVSLFSSFVLTRAAQAAALAAGFRPRSDEVLKSADPADGFLTPNNGVTISAASQPPLPFPADVSSRIFDGWKNYKRPSAVVVILDTSGTISAGALFGAQKMARTIISATGGKDLTGLVTFSDKVQVVSELSADKYKSTSGLTGLTPGGGSAIYQAMSEAVRLATKEEYLNFRKNIIVFTDGKDNNSQISLTELLDFLADRRKHYDINIQVLALSSPGVDLSDLEKIAAEGEGHFWRVTLGEVDSVTIDILNRYW